MVELDYQRRLAARRIRKINKILTKDLSPDNRRYWQRKLGKWHRRQAYLETRFAGGAAHGN